MATRLVTYTHKGWFGLCPVYIGGVDSDEPDVRERLPLFAPLMWLTLQVFQLLFTLGEVTNPMYEPEWPLTITGELERPLQLEEPEVVGP